LWGKLSKIHRSTLPAGRLAALDYTVQNYSDIREGEPKSEGNIALYKTKKAAAGKASGTRKPEKVAAI
jgi:hypothetical protein